MVTTYNIDTRLLEVSLDAHEVLLAHREGLIPFLRRMVRQGGSTQARRITIGVPVLPEFREENPR